ncbi:hypothetical protein HPB51_013923 [Rhipicephalus microplus]|uniref:THAP-type domain-containing protein n=1 Tax=Rhipicephalus microplus TaxID=6941 RepID=A0A9J6DH58_RHIMP|nr:hypothetical protein HPB51_013923 [Rhipicephalus microplus]
MPTCYVPGCTNGYAKDIEKSGRHFFIAPSDETFRSAWNRVIPCAIKNSRRSSRGSPPPRRDRRPRRHSGDGEKHHWGKKEPKKEPEEKASVFHAEKAFDSNVQECSSVEA